MDSLTDVVDEELEYGHAVCGDDERTRFDRRRPGMVAECDHRGLENGSLECECHQRAIDLMKTGTLQGGRPGLIRSLFPLTGRSLNK
jgi:hypothetical protein